MNERLLAALGLRWDVPVSPPERWRERPAIRALVPEADALIASEFANAPHIVLHDPRLAITAPFWRERLEALEHVVSAMLFLRRPIEVAASIAKRTPFAPEKTLSLWLHYLCEGERASRGMPRTLLTYDRLLDAPAGVMAHVIAETRFALRLERSDREAALTAIRPDLKRFGEGRELPTGTLSSGIDTALEAGYRELVKLPPGTDPRRAIESLAHAAYAPLMQAIPPWLGQELSTNRSHAERQAEALLDANGRIATLESELARHRNAQASRDRDEAALRERLDTLSRGTANEGRDARMDDALAKLHGDVARIASTLSEQQAREQALRSELSQAQRDLEDERSTIARLSDGLENERSLGDAANGKLDVAQSHLEALVAEIEQSRVAQAAWSDHNNALMHDLEDLRNAFHLLENERDGLRRQNEEARQQFDKLKNELDSARTDLRIVDNDRTTLAARARAVDEAATGLREELGRRAATEATITDERDRMAAEVRNQLDRIHGLERDLSRRVAELTSVSGRHDTLAKTVSMLQRTWLGRKALEGTRRAPG